jgi:hypothetical protein
METEPKYMLVGSYENSIRNNLEIIDYNLTKREAEAMKTDLIMQQNFGETQEEWLLDTNVRGELDIKIVQQTEELF